MKVLRWNVAGLSEDLTDIFLSQISMLTDWDVLLLQECFRKLDGVNVGSHELFTPSELLGGLRCPAVIMHQKWSGEQMDCGRAGWTDDLHFSPPAAQEKESGRVRADSVRNPKFRDWQAWTAPDLGRRFQCEPVYGIDGLSPRWRINPKTEKMLDTNETLRARALHTVVAELDLTVTNTWMDADTDQDLYTRSSWSDPSESQTQMDFIMTSRNLVVKQVRFLDSARFRTDHKAVYAVLALQSKNEIHEEKQCELAWLETKRDMAEGSCGDDDRLEELECGGASVVGNGKGTQERGHQGDVDDGARAQVTSVEKEKRRKTTWETGAEQTLSRNMEKTKSSEARETHEQDQGKCGEWKSSQENTEQTLQLELDREKRKPRNGAHEFLQIIFFDSRERRGKHPSRTSTLDRAVEEHENRLCWWNTDLTTEIG